ncbi:thioredoxin family protein [Thiolapillus sp.]
MLRSGLLFPALLALLWLGSPTLKAATDDPLVFDDVPLREMVRHPDWFKESFLDLQDDLQEALDNGKQGIIVYFGQKRCPYCRQLMEVNFRQPDIVKYTRSNFDVIAIDIWSPEEVTDPAGNTMTQRDYAVKMGTNFTPSLIFYDASGNIALRLRGYYPPYQFRAALEYVADEHYKREPFNYYLARGDSTLRFEAEDMVEEEFFLPPPHNLDRSRFPGERPLAVFFEAGNCHACDILHTQPLRQPAILELLEAFEAVQLNMYSAEPVITPDGRKTSARRWAESLGIFYAPTLVFFDENGREIIRVDSVVHFFRLRNVLNYILAKGYLSHPSFQLWRSAERRR